jgi:hypothetical protein
MVAISVTTVSCVAVEVAPVTQQVAMALCNVSISAEDKGGPDAA